MKYWLVTNEFPPTGGGIAPYCLNTAEMLDQAGIETRVFFCDPAAERASIHRLSKVVSLVRYHHTRLSDDAPIANPFGDAAWTSWNTAEFLEEAVERWGKPDVIEFQDFGAMAYFTLQKRYCLNRHFAGVKIVLTAHRPLIHALATDGQSTSRLPAFFIGEMERWTFRAADAVFYPSEFLAERLAQPDIGFRHNAAFIVRNPFELTSGARLGEAAGRATVKKAAVGETPETATARFRQHVETLGAWPSGWIRPEQRDQAPIGFFAKLQDQKGARDLLHLMDRWWSEGGRTPLEVFGRDAFSDALQGSMQAHLEHRYRGRIDQGLLRFRGAYKRTEMKDIAGRCAVAVLPYREECMPYATLEIISAGMIPLCAPGGGQRELIALQWRDRLIYDPADYEDFCDKLQWALIQPPESRREITTDLLAHIASIASYDVVLASKLEAIEQTPAPQTRTSFPFINDIPRAANTREDLRPAVSGRVSVVVPYYNMQDYVEDAIESVLATDYPDLEIIVVNDGSTAPEALDKLEELKTNRLYRQFVKVISKRNAGLASARNAGGETATGEFLLFLDADDMISPAFISRCLDILRAYPDVSYASSWLRRFGEGKGEWIAWICEFPYLLYHSTQHCTVLIRRDDWLSHGLNDESMTLGMEDYESFIRMTAKGVRGVAIPDYLFHHRARAGSMMRGFTPELQAALYRTIQKKHQKLFNQYGDTLQALVAENGHGAFVSDPTRETETARKTFADRRNTWEHANASFKAKDFPESAAVSRGLILKNPDSPAAPYLLAQSLVQQGRSPVEAFGKYSVAAKGDNQHWPLLMRASLMLEFSARIEGQTELKALLGRDPVARADAVWVANEQLWRGAPASAHGLAAAATEAKGDIAWATSLKALMCAGRLTPTAEFRSNSDVWKKPQRATTHLALAMAALHAGDIESGVSELGDIQEDEAPETFLAQGVSRYAELLAHSGREASALTLIGWGRGRQLGADAAGRLADLETAIGTAIQSRAALRKARADRDFDKLEEAKAALFAAMPQHMDARCEAADDAFALKEDELALQHLNAVHGASAAMVQPWYWARRFQALAALGRQTDAEAALRELVAADNGRQSGEDLLQRINMVIAAGRTAEAHRYLGLLRPAYDRLEDIRLWWCSTGIDAGHLSPRIDDDLSKLIASSKDKGRQIWARYHKARLAGQLGQIDTVRTIVGELRGLAEPDALSAANSLIQTFKLADDGKTRSVMRPN